MKTRHISSVLNRRLEVPGYWSRQRGASLVVSLLMLVAVLLLGISAAQIALQGEKASRGDRDRQVAFQAAEAALMDAEMDIESSPASNSRSVIFKETKTVRTAFIVECGAETTNQSFGLCEVSQEGQTPVWLKVDFSVTGSSAKSVPYGHFTGQFMQTGTGSTPARLPRYIIEIMNYKVAASDPTIPSNHAPPADYFRITAIGFGMKDSTQVVLQSYYRKVEDTEK